MSAPALQPSRTLRGYVTAFRGDLEADALPQRGKHRSHMTGYCEPTIALLRRVLEGLRQL